MFTSIKTYCDELVNQFDTIPAGRKILLSKLSDYIAQKIQHHEEVNLVYICTHNSRRSHFGELWGKVASTYFNIPRVRTFSGGTEATAFNPNAIRALEHIGFKIKQVRGGANPVYEVQYSSGEPPIVCFSKAYNNAVNPKKAFAAIMTCSEAEKNCPFIPGAERRIACPYDDPKIFDGTAQQDQKYSERCRQIAIECLYVFSCLNTQKLILAS